MPSPQTNKNSSKNQSIRTNYQALSPHRQKAKSPSKQAIKRCATRRGIEWHMEQRQLKQELQEFDIA
ncbi:PA3496 family putative envelope integrity protein [Shewanella fidelis]|uniref:PA3496 family putative envelope integrity protein n=1 Tax=Shewanella fidelis TaxID=173509 RepID=UPI00048BA634